MPPDKGNECDFAGIVVTNHGQVFESSCYYVYILQAPQSQNEFLRKLIGIHSCAFDVRTLLDQENFANDAASAKQKQRHLDKPLIFGDFIKWTSKEMFPQEGLRVGGVRAPHESFFWNEHFPTSFDQSLMELVEPDVWVYAWYEIFLKTDQDSANFLKVEAVIAEFDGCDIAQQHNVNCAPWNENKESKPFSLKGEAYPAYDDDIIAVAEPESKLAEPSVWKDIIENRIGLVVGQRSIMNFHMQQYDFIIPVLRPVYYEDDEFNKSKAPVYISQGQYVQFSAKWSSFHLAFITTKVEPFAQMVSHLVLDGKFIANVKPKLGMPAGFYEDVSQTLGTVDDPDGLLATYSLSPFWGKEIKVGLLPWPPSGRVRDRFSIVSLFRGTSEDDVADQFHFWNEEEQITLRKVQGIVVSESGEVFSLKYPGLIFRLPDSAHTAIGLNVVFDAVRPPGSRNMFKIVEFELSKNVAKSIVNCCKRFMSKDYPTKNSLFRVEVSTRPEYRGLFYNEFLGFIDPMEIFKEEELAYGQKYVVWAMPSMSEAGRRRSRAVFEVVSAKTSSPRGIDLEGIPSGASSVSSISSASSRASTQTRFSGPGFSVSAIDLEDNVDPNKSIDTISVKSDKTTKSYNSTNSAFDPYTNKMVLELTSEGGSCAEKYQKVMKMHFQKCKQDPSSRLCAVGCPFTKLIKALRENGGLPDLYTCEFAAITRDVLKICENNE